MPADHEQRDAPSRGVPRPAAPSAAARCGTTERPSGTPRRRTSGAEDRECGGAIWPGQRRASHSNFFAPAETTEHGSRAPIGDILRRQARSSFRGRYLEVTDFVLSEVRARYQAAGVDLQ